MGVLHNRQYGPVVALGSTYCATDSVVFAREEAESLTTLPHFQNVEPVFETHFVSLNEPQALINRASLV